MTQTKDIVYETDASQLKGELKAVLMAKTITEISNAVRLNSNIVPRGAGTGFMGGTIPNNSLVIDLSKLNKILEFDERRKTIKVEAGITLAEINEFLEKYNLEFPVKPFSHEICTIGGMIATDASGFGSMKYGKTSRWIDYIEIINPEGNLQKKTKAELSDFTGLEGITGIIVKANLRLIEKKNIAFSLVSKEFIEEIIELTSRLKRNSRIILIEFFDKKASELLGLEKQYNLLVAYEHPQKQNQEKYKELLFSKNNAYFSLIKQGYSKIEDIKIFLDKFKELMPWFEKNNIPIFGDLGIGIIHPCFPKEQEERIHELMNILKKAKGKIKGEYGIGLRKKQYLDELDKNLYKAVKKRNDPENKFNPGKIIN